MFISAVWNKAAWNNNTAFGGNGSGAFIDATHILTAAHVIYNVDSSNNGHFANTVTIMVGRDGSKPISYNGTVCTDQSMCIDSLYNGVPGNNDLAVITINSTNGVPAHYNFTVANNADLLNYSGLQLQEIGYPGDTFTNPTITPGVMYYTYGYAIGINTTEDWFNNTPLLQYQDHPWNDGGGLSISKGQSGSPIFYENGQDQFVIVGVVSCNDTLLVNGQPVDHTNPTGYGYATAMTLQMSIFIETCIKEMDGDYAAHIRSSGQMLIGAPTSPGTSTISLVASTTTAVLGGEVILTATVPSDGGTPDGSVTTFTDNGVYLGQAVVQDGQATLTTYALPIGANSLVASCPYGTSYYGVLSPAVMVTITALPVLWIDASSLPTIFGSYTYLTATIPDDGTSHNGWIVSFYEGSNFLGQATVENGQATFSTNTLPVGSYPVVASADPYGNGVPGEGVLSSPVTVSVVNSPTGTTATDQPDFIWQPLYGAVSYDIDVVDDTTKQTLPLITGVPPGATTASYQTPISRALTPGHSYTWYYGAVFGTGAIYWSALRTSLSRQWPRRASSVPSAIQPSQPAPATICPRLAGPAFPTPLTITSSWRTTSRQPRRSSPAPASAARRSRRVHRRR